MDSVWIRAFAVTARLAGESEGLCDALEPDAREAALRQMELLRAEDRPESARKLVAARIALMRRGQRVPSVEPGAGLLAAWLRSLPATERIAAVRSLDGSTASAVLARVATATPLGAQESRALSSVATVALRCLGRALTVEECSELFMALSSRGELLGASAVRVERALRARGLRAEAAEMARGAAVRALP